jgi:PAS domain S-box-containing protein
VAHYALSPEAHGDRPLLELLFSQSLDGFFFMMLDEPIHWDESADKDELLDYVFAHQRITRVNHAMLAQYGATRDAFVGLTPSDFYRHDLEAGRRIWREFFDRGQLHVKTDERRFDGTPMVIEGDYICLYDAGRRIIGHFGIQRDVTKEAHLQREVSRHAAELERRVVERTAALAQSENRIRAIVNALPDVVFVLDRDGRYVEIVTEDETRLYRADSELLGRPVPDAMPDRAASVLVEVAKAALDTNATQVREYQIAESSRTRWFEARSAPLCLGSGDNVPSAVVIVRDITDRNRANELEHQNVYLREAFDADLHFGEILGRSAAMQEVFKAIELVANTDSSVLLLGETGTGKELIARAIHRSSRRRSAVMVKVNCGALHPTLIESELFGHERGAFTGAVQQRKGRFELADQGTIFLDEVGELPPEAQVKLLRVLQEQEFERVGGSRTVHIDARVIAASNRDLALDVQAQRFRADLFFRLNIFPIRVPPLRDRREDVPALARHFVRQFASRAGRSIDRIDGLALERLSAYDWPGNVRELANILERAVILCEGPVLQTTHLGLPGAHVATSGELLTLEEAERRHILKALEKTGGVLAGPGGAAALLGVNRSTLWSRMRKLGIPS